MTKMSRQHFQFIADVLRDHKELVTEQTESFGISGINPPVSIIESADQLVERFVNELSRTNPNFDRQRFRVACDK